MELGKNYLLSGRYCPSQPESGVGGVLLEFLAGVCLTLFQIKKYHFPYLFSDQTSKIHTRFQTWSLG